MKCCESAFRGIVACISSVRAPERKLSSPEPDGNKEMLRSSRTTFSLFTTAIKAAAAERWTNHGTHVFSPRALRHCRLQTGRGPCSLENWGGRLRYGVPCEPTLLLRRAESLQQTTSQGESCHRHWRQQRSRVRNSLGVCQEWSGSGIGMPRFTKDEGCCGSDQEGDWQPHRVCPDAGTDSQDNVRTFAKRWVDSKKPIHL
ncbi:hypothetical protein M427DRAFT_137587 [Gonapodya prolifera JEL478]|uniref:Uncharacterized protein n=1 Tax=Gonapodya prolifera (strain JEL478) TaxID=1344416 RepID=A0A139A5C1_GONPJ|nr:hypothetical protein M427DRAFT_137587 [Gonapodya prolifera JEL478]|eukprot:KXS12022.1 hypothetical protein M427DRAFT_137587 [Gonapodya prolifera JEL478]